MAGKNKKKEKAYHVVEVALQTTPREARIIDQHLQVVGKYRNAVLAKLMKRANAMKRDKRYKECAAKPSGEERNEGFRSLRDEYGLGSRAGENLAKVVLDEADWMRDHVPAATAQAEAADVAVSVNQWLYGKRGKPRPKPSAEHAVAWGASAKSPIRYDAKANELVITTRLKRKNMRLTPKRKQAEVERLVNGGAVGRAAVKRETVRGKHKYFALIRVEGKPYRKRSYLEGVAHGERVGLDAGPSKLVVTSLDASECYSFDRAPGELLGRRKEEAARIRRAKRALDRSLRASNPDCFDGKGRFIRGRRATNRSAAWRRKQGKLGSEQRRQRINRRQDETAITRKIMEIGNNVTAEDINYSQWQASRYGRRMGFTAPGGLMSRTRHETSVTDGSFKKVPIRTGLTQYCVCGERVSKTLADRVHECPRCGLVADRDALPAWMCALIDAAGLSPDGVVLSRGPLLGAAAAATRYEPNDAASVAELGGRLTPRDSGFKPLSAPASFSSLGLIGSSGSGSFREHPPQQSGNGHAGQTSNRGNEPPSKGP